MTFLSQYRLSPHACRALRLTDTYSLHRIILDLFPQGERPDDKAGRILFADKGTRNGLRTLLVLSPCQPLLNGPGELATKIVPERFLEHAAYRFEIVVNPVCSKKAATEQSSAVYTPAQGKNDAGKRTPLRDRQDIAAWFEKRAAGWGFQVEDLQVEDVWADCFDKKSPSCSGPRLITLNKAQLRGVLAVTSRASFRHAFTHGLGHGRAFGCGLLQLMPLHN